MTSNHAAPEEGAVTGSQGLDDRSPSVQEYDRYAGRIAILEQNLRQVQAEILAVRERYADDVAHNWRAGLLGPGDALDAYRAGRAIGADLGVTGWGAVWQGAGMPAVQRLTAMAAQSAP